VNVEPGPERPAESAPGSLTAVGFRMRYDRARNNGTKSRKLSPLEDAIRVLTALEGHAHIARHIISLADTARWLVEEEEGRG
jgi:hypothetical protein